MSLMCYNSSYLFMIQSNAVRGAYAKYNVLQYIAVSIQNVTY